MYHVVIADDAPSIRMLTRLWLETSGEFDIVGEAANGRDAVRLSTEQQPDVVLLDLSMPDVDGLETIPLILESSPGARVIVLSALEQSRGEPAALGQGAVAYIDKRTAGPDLADRLLIVLDGAGDDAGERAG